MPWGPSAVMRSFFGTEGLGPPRSILQLEKSQAGAVEQIFLGQHAPEDATITSYGLSVSAECVAQARRSGTFLVHPVPASSSRPRGSATVRKAINRIAAVADPSQREESRLKERMAKAVAAALQTPRDLELDAGLPQPPIADVRCAHRRQAAARDDLGREPRV
jgi:hypothetical protein